MSWRISGSHMPLLVANIFFAFLLLYYFGFNCTVKMSKRVEDMPVGKNEKKESK